MSTPKVSVCLLTFNRASVLPRTINSILAQDFKDFELIINDDCSTDNTAEICQNYVRRDRRVVYYRNERNLRYAGNQNAAMERARGEFLAYVHDGDVYYPFMLQKWVEALTKYSSAAIVFNAADVLPEHGVKSTTHVHDYDPLVPGKVLFDEMITSASSPIFGIVMLRTAVLRSLGNFDTKLPVLADVDMWLRLLLKHDAAYVRSPLYSIMPREVGHVNRPPHANWSIQAEFDRIYVLNLARRYGGWDRVPPAQRRGLLLMRGKEIGRALAICLLRGGFSKFAEGVRALAKGRPFGTTVDLRRAINQLSFETAAEDA